VKLDAAPPPGTGHAVQVDVVRHLVVRIVAQMEFDRVALAHADEFARNRAAERPEHVGHAFGNRQFFFDDFEFDDHLRRIIAARRRRHHRRRGEYGVDRFAARRAEIAVHVGARRLSVRVRRGAQRKRGKQQGRNSASAKHRVHRSLRLIARSACRTR